MVGVPGYSSNSGVVPNTHGKVNSEVQLTSRTQCRLFYTCTLLHDDSAKLDIHHSCCCVRQPKQWSGAAAAGYQYIEG